MASRISSTRRDKNRANRGFTLVEVLIASSLGLIILAGVLTSFLMMGRISANVQNYSEIEAAARKAMEMMSREFRSAFAITSYSGTSVTLSIPDSTGTVPSTTSGSAPLYNQQAASGAYSVTYTYDSTNKLLTRTGPPILNPTGTSTTETLMNNATTISGASVFTYYRYVNTNYLNSYTNGYENNEIAVGSPISGIQQIEVKFLASRASTTVVTANNKVISARFVLRNKRS